MMLLSNTSGVVSRFVVLHKHHCRLDIEYQEGAETNNHLGGGTGGQMTND